jgi:RNA polymerase sigma-70 factor (ECF subfamily)
MTEQQIISKAKKGDRSAQTLLYQEYQSVWYSICLRYNKNRQDALDVLQNALIKVFTKIDQFDQNKGSFKSWSAQVVVNENLMYLRKLNINYKIDPIDAELQVADQQESALDILSAEELTKMIQKLPDGYRAVFNMYVIEGYQHKEIAELLQISVGTSKSQLFKAKRLLQEKLEVLL